MTVDRSLQRWIPRVMAPNARGAWPRPFRIHVGSAHAAGPCGHGGGRFHPYPRRVAERQSGQRLLGSGAVRLARCRGIDFPQPPLNLQATGAVRHEQSQRVAGVFSGRQRPGQDGEEPEPSQRMAEGIHGRAPAA